MPQSTQTKNRPVRVRRVWGLDFSGAAQSGKNAWLAQCDVTPDDRLRLTHLDPLERLAGTPDRDAVNQSLVGAIQNAPETLIGADFPFGLPIELGLGDWPDQLAHVAAHDGDAKTYGRHLVDLTQQRCDGSKHVRRQTDRETATPFDCYHYRIIYQTFHGMRDLLVPLAADPSVAVLPFQPIHTKTQTLVAEACPSSTLKRLGLPHQNYKHPGRPGLPKHRQTRNKILQSIATQIAITPHRRRVIQQNPGGDALDAVLAAIGVWSAHRRHTPTDFHENPRYRREGMVYC